MCHHVLAEKVVKAEYRDDVRCHPGKWVLTYECGHSLERQYLPRTWKPPKNYSMWEVLAADFFPERPFFS
jgi:hypothetical protein